VATGDSDGGDGDRHHLAEVNVARLRMSIEDPAMASFVRAIDDVNWLADQSPGFVWRHPADPGPVAFGSIDGEDDLIVTLSIWEDPESLRNFVTRTAHGLFMRQRSRWFVPTPGFTTALWWVVAGARPSIADGIERLEHLRTHGPSPEAFSFVRLFDKP
jgi:hypothetical protein